MNDSHDDDSQSDTGPSAGKRGHRAPRWRGLRFGVTAAVLLVTGLLVGALGATAFSAHAFGGHHGRDGQHMMEHVRNRVSWVLGRIDASEEQERRIEAIVDDTIETLASARDERQQTRHDFVAEMLAGAVDRDRIEVLRQQHLVQHDRLSAVVVQGLAEVAEVLTPEQRRQLHDMGPFRRH
jgi:Spy/CpxP family protein refolding chaperone